MKMQKIAKSILTEFFKKSAVVYRAIFLLQPSINRFIIKFHLNSFCKLNLKVEIEDQN